MVASGVLICTSLWLTSMLALKQGNVTLCLDVLTPLAEEADSLQHIKRQAIMPALIHSSQGVFQLLGSLMTGTPCQQSPSSILELYAMPNQMCSHFRRCALTEYLMRMPTLYAGSTVAGSKHGLHLAALQSARVWLALDPDGAGTACVSPGNLMQSQVQGASNIAELWL